MSDMINNKLNEEALGEVVGGNDGMGEGTFSVMDITPTLVKVTASVLNVRYYPNGDIATTLEKGRIVQATGITSDGLWYRFWMQNPKFGGECAGYIFKEYTQKI